MDKAPLLTEVISKLKELKNSTMEISQGVTVPQDANEIKVEVNGEMGCTFSIKMSLCGADRPDLLADLKQTLLNLQMKTIKAEISAVGGRVKNEIIFPSSFLVNRD